MTDVTKNAPQMAIMQLGNAFMNFFAGRAKYPRFHKEGVHDRFTLTNDQFAVDGSRIRVPHLGWVRMREALRFPGTIMSATVSRVADCWFVSIAVDTQDAPPQPAENQGVVGVDLGMSALATLSTGEQVAGTKLHTVLRHRLKRRSRAWSRKQTGSRNRQKTKARLARLHVRIANIRRETLHKLTTDLTRRFHTIGVEDLHVRGMMSNRRLARAIADMGFHEFRRQLDYKAQRRGGQIVVADRWFPSSKTCSGCGVLREALPLSVRQWTGARCGAHHDREVNAAKNLERYAVSSTVSACGGEGTGLGRKRKVKPSPLKQEPNGRGELCLA
jgi:putative transposase